MAKNKKRMTNFDIENYIYLTYTDFINSKSIRTTFSLKKTVEETQNRLNEEFKTYTGYTPEEFVIQFNLNNEVFGILADFLHLSSAQEFTDFTKNNGEEISKKLGEFIKNKKALNTILTTGKISAYANTLNALSKNNKGLYQNVSTSLEGIDFPKGVYEKYIKALGQNNEAAMAILIDTILQDYKSLKLDGENNIIAMGDFQLNLITGIDNLWKEATDIIKKKKKTAADNKRLKTILNNIRTAINTNVKGANLGELTGRLISANIMTKKIENDVIKGLNKSISKVSHVGRKTWDSPNNIVQTGVGLFDGSDGKKTFKLANISSTLAELQEGLIKDPVSIVYKNQKPDIMITLKNKETNKPVEVPMSVKQLSPSSKNITFSQDIPLGVALKWAGADVYERFLTKEGRETQSFLNIMNMLLAQSSFNKSQKDAKIIIPDTYGQKYSFEALNALSNKMLTNVGLAILAGQFKKETALLLDINGQIIPTPLYFKYASDLILQNKRSLASFISFKASAGKDTYVKSIVAAGSKKAGEADNSARATYTVLATLRNDAAMRRIVSQKVKVSAYFLKPKEYLTLMGNSYKSKL